MTPPDAGLDCAILCTVLYADVFEFALTISELHHYLLHHRPVSLAEVRSVLHGSDWLAGLLTVASEHVCLRDRETLLTLRAQREAYSAELQAEIAHCGRWLARLPFVRMVGLTGALAMHNPASIGDDFDFLLVTAPGRVWLTRMLAVLVVRLVRLRGRVICPNYVLDTDALSQRRCDLYIAHEVAQIVPLYGDAVYDALRAANGWTLRLLPNAERAFRSTPVALTRADSLFKRVLERILGGRLGDLLEGWELRRKQRRWASALRVGSAAVLDAHQMKGHFDDHGARVLMQYAARLSALGISEDLIDSAAAD